MLAMRMLTSWCFTESIYHVYYFKLAWKHADICYLGLNTRYSWGILALCKLNIWTELMLSKWWHKLGPLVFLILPEWNMNVCRKFLGEPLNSCKDISLKTTVNLDFTNGCSNPDTRCWDISQNEWNFDPLLAWNEKSESSSGHRGHVNSI